MCLKLDPLQKLATEELEPTIDIANSEAEQDSHQESPRLAVDASNQIVGSPDSPTNDHIVVDDPRGEQLDVGRVELPITVTQEYVGQARSFNPGNHRTPVALVALMVNHPDMRIGRHHTIYDFAGAVPATVIDYNNFVIVRHLGQLTGKPANDPLDVPFFVVRGKKYRQAGEAGCKIHLATPAALHTRPLHSSPISRVPQHYASLAGTSLR